MRTSPAFGFAGLALALGLVACGTPGLLGKLTFFDETQGNPSSLFSGGFAGPIAVGATVQVGVATHSGTATVTSAKSGDSAVLEVKGFKDDQITLHAGSAGQSELLVTASNQQDGVILSTASIASSKVEVGHGLFSWSLPDALLSKGFALTPLVELPMFLRQLDANGATLTGFGATPITASPSSAVVPEASSDAFTLVAPATSGSSIGLTAAKLNEKFAVVDPAQLTTFTLIELGYSTTAGTDLPGSVGPVPAAFVVPGGTGIFTLAATLPDGRFVFAPAEGSFDFVIDPDSTSLVELLDPTTPFAQWNDPSRIVVINFKSPGAAHFSIHCFGQTSSFVATITSA